MSSNYDSSAIEVLSGLDPVRRRPGMYTDTSRPNHLAHEVIDNSVDEALAGHCRHVAVTLFRDGSLQVADDGRGMPVDVHPREKVPGVELILTRLHSGAKFSSKNYRFSGGLHGVGVAVVNALSSHLEVWVRRDGHEYNMAFRGGNRASALEQIGKTGKTNTGTTIRFWPDPEYFDTPQFSVAQLQHMLQAKAVLCPGLRVTLEVEHPEQHLEWQYSGGLGQYLAESAGDAQTLPAEPFTGEFRTEHDEVEWALFWMDPGTPLPAESYVNLIPTPQGGTHVTGLRGGLTEALREYCDFRSLMPRGLRLAPEDVWHGVAYVLSVKLEDPQFSGQTKERLSSRHCSGLVSTAVKDAFALWLNQHAETGDLIAERAIAAAQKRTRAAQRVKRKKIVAGPALPGKLADCSDDNPELCELFLVEGDSAGGSAKQARDRRNQAVLPLRGKILNTWEVEQARLLASQEVNNISLAIGVEPGSSDLSSLRYHKICILADADSDGQHISTLICALFLRHFPQLVHAGHVYVAMPPLFRIDMGRQVFYALDEAERGEVLRRIETENLKGKLSITRFKGLGEMSPGQLRETTMAAATRRLVQLTVDPESRKAEQLLDMLLAKKRAADRRSWIEAKGDLAQVQG